MGSRIVAFGIGYEACVRDYGCSGTLSESNNTPMSDKPFSRNGMLATWGYCISYD